MQQTDETEKALLEAQAKVNHAVAALDAACAARQPYIAKLHRDGWTIRRIAERINTSTTAVWRALHRSAA